MRYNLDMPGEVSFLQVGGQTIAVGNLGDDIVKQVSKTIMQLPNGKKLRGETEKLLKVLLPIWNDNFDVSVMSDSEIAILLSKITQKIGID